MEQLRSVIDILSRLEGTLVTSAFLAGGAVRDALHGLEIKDYDIFVPAPILATLDVHDFEDLAKTLGPGWVYTHAIPDEYFEGNMAEECGPIVVFEYRDADGWPTDTPPIQLIGLKMRPDTAWLPWAVLNRIDIGLCRALVTSDGRVLTTPEYYEDALNRTLTIVDKRDPERSLKRATRIQAKYPEFTIVP